LTEGHVAAYQGIVGSRLRLMLDQVLGPEVTGSCRPLAPPGFVCDVAIGQSTLVTRRVIGNLFYRGLALRRQPFLDDTLRTSVEIVGLRQNRPRPDRSATGLVALRVVTVDQEERPVLDFHRCAMLPLRDSSGKTGREDDLDSLGDTIADDDLVQSVAGWRLDKLRGSTDGPHFDELSTGLRWTVDGGDVVTSAPELARLSLNVAFAHHDAAAGRGGRRLVYGGHTIGIAGAQLTRSLPAAATIAAWHSCDHLGPVFEGDTLRTSIEIEALRPLAEGGGLVHLRLRTDADREDGSVPVLDWRPVVVMA